MYAAVRALVGRGGPVTARLSANFRSAPALVAWLNDRFDRLLGTAPAGEPGFDPHAGTVANEPLVAGREADGEDRAPRALLLPLAGPEDGGVDELRAVEGPAIAAFLRALVERGERRVVDPATGERRPVRYGDVAVLCAATTQLGFLLPALDRMGVPFAARGSTLFLDDPLHRQLLLALRALSDRDDGVAEAAILRPPFFAVDVADLAAARAAPEGSTDPGVVRARAARAKLAELRRRRLDGPPGAAARALVEETALARAVALGPNAAQRLDGLRELCLQLERLAAEEGLDLDAATGRLRAWAVEPVQLDPPRPVGRDAVQVLSTHQAKGLEFPVVVLWDACARLASPTGAPAFAIDRDGAAWAVKIDGLEWSEPPGSALAAREKAFLDAERRRLVYVAATRARDWLVVPFAGPDGRSIHGALGDGAPPGLVEVLEPYGPGAEAPAWAAGVAPPAPPAPGDAGPLAARVEAAWGAARADAGAPRLAPTSVTAEAHREDAAGAGAEEEGVAGARPRRESRFGPVFGDTVHRAIGLALARPALSPAEAVAAAARATGLPERRDEAEEDVARALAGLEREGLRRPPGPDLRLEYPVALGEGERLVQGYVDLLGTAGGRLAVVDFKTDAPPAGDVRETHAAYVAQVRAYARIVAALGLAAPGEVRAGLLFTADGEVRWVA
jgi:ATP-dependent helicase/nuclease subunit A